MSGIGKAVIDEATITEGYTHSWGHEGFEDDEWKKLTKIVKQIISKAKKDKIEIAGGDGSGKPTISDKVISLNGKGDDGYETLRITKATQDFEFCKTNENPYDPVVVSILAAAKKINKKFKPRSDGGAAAIKRVY